MRNCWGQFCRKKILEKTCQSKLLFKIILKTVWNANVFRLLEMFRIFRFARGSKNGYCFKSTVFRFPKYSFFLYVSFWTFSDNSESDMSSRVSQKFLEGFGNKSTLKRDWGLSTFLKYNLYFKFFLLLFHMKLGHTSTEFNTECLRKEIPLK